MEASVEMTFKEASGYKFKTGKNAGRTIGFVGCTDEGLQFLVRLSGMTDLHPNLKAHLERYLNESSIAREVDLLDDGDYD